MHKVVKNFSCSPTNFGECMPYINWARGHVNPGLLYRCDVHKDDLSYRLTSVLLSFLHSGDFQLPSKSAAPSFQSDMYPGLRGELCGHP